MRKLVGIALLVTALAGSVACRREVPPTPGASAPASAAAAATAAPSSATAGQSPTAGKPAAGTQRAKLVSGSLGQVSAGIQLWSKPGGVLAGGSTMTGVVPEGAAVEVLKTEDFLGKKYYDVKGIGEHADKEGWVEDRFVQLQ